MVIMTLVTAAELSALYGVLSLLIKVSGLHRPHRDLCGLPVSTSAHDEVQLIAELPQFPGLGHPHRHGFIFGRR